MSRAAAAAALPLEAAACLFCGVDDSVPEASTFDYEYETTTQRFTIVRCRRCGHLYLNPRPSPDAAAQLYPSSYYTQADAHVSGGLGLLGAIKNRVMIHRARPLLDALPAGAAVLELGCGDGALLQALRRARADLALTGVDLGFTAAQTRRLGADRIDTVTALIEEARFPAQSVDLVVMNQVVEHLWRPRDVLLAIHTWLRPGGRLSLATPNAGGYDRRWFRRGTWGGYYAPRHFNLFTRESLTRLLRECGFGDARVTDLVAPLVWVRNFSYAATAHRWPGGAFFADQNLPLLALFSGLDLLARAAGAETSNQQCVAIRR